MRQEIKEIRSHGGTQLRVSDAPTVSVVLEASDPGGGLIAKSRLTLATPWSVARQVPLAQVSTQTGRWGYS